MGCTCGGVLEYSEISDQMVCDACGSSPDSGDSDAGLPVRALCVRKLLIMQAL